MWVALTARKRMTLACRLLQLDTTVGGWRTDQWNDYDFIHSFLQIRWIQNCLLQNVVVSHNLTNMSVANPLDNKLNTLSASFWED